MARGCGWMGACAGAMLAGIATANPGDLYVTSDFFDVTSRYTGATGVYQAAAATSSLPFSGQLGVSFTSRNTMLVGHFSGGIAEFDLAGNLVQQYPATNWAWSAIESPAGNTFVADSASGSIIEYDATNGNFIRSLGTGLGFLADMRYGPNGNLYVCGFTTSMVYEIDPVSGNVVGSWATPQSTQPNDILFMPDGRIIVTTMRGPQGQEERAWVYDNTYSLVTSFTDPSFGRIHGIALSPWDGNIYIADGVTAQVSVFDPVTYALLDSSFLSPDPGAKIVDLEFLPIPSPGSAMLLLMGGLGMARRRR